LNVAFAVTAVAWEGQS